MSFVARETILMFGLSFFFTVLPIMLSSRVQRKADRMRITIPDKLCFRASIWAYTVVPGGLLMSAGFVVLGYLGDYGTSGLYFFKVIGTIGVILTVLAFVSLKKTRVIFEEDGFRYTTLAKAQKIRYDQILLAYGSNGFITVKLENNKAVPMQILFEQPAKLLATIRLYAYKARHDPSRLTN
jgi:hypothetical protein